MFKKLVFFGIALMMYYDINAQRVGIGTDNPLAHLSVDSSLMVDQSNSNFGNLSKGALLFGSDGLVGIGRSTLAGSGARSGIGFYTGGVRRLLVDSLGRLGIATSTPLQALHVSGNAYVSGNLGVGIPDPQFDLHIGNSARIGTYMGINADPDFINRLRVNGDSYFENSNVGINIAPSGSYSLYASGSVRFTGDVRVDGILNPNNPLTIGNNTTIDGSLTVGGRGIVRGSGTAQWRLVRLTVGYAGGLAANSDLIGAQLAYNLGGATVAGIFVGPVVQAGAGSSNLSSIGLVPVDVTNTTCRFMLMNASSTDANMGTAATPTIWQLTMLVFD